MHIPPRPNKPYTPDDFNKHTLLMIINSLVFSKLLYCSNAWANTSKCNINKLQAVQNFACRIMSGARKYDHVTPIRKELNKACMYVCKCIKLYEIKIFFCLINRSLRYAKTIGRLALGFYRL